MKCAAVGSDKPKMTPLTGGNSFTFIDLINFVIINFNDLYMYIYKYETIIAMYLLLL